MIAQRPVVRLSPRPHDPRRSCARFWLRRDMDRPILDLTWDYPDKGALDNDPDAEAVLAEINGWERRWLARCRSIRVGRRWLDSLRLLDLLRRLCRWREPGRTAQTGDVQDWVAAEWGWAWPANRRILYNRASAIRTAGRGASARPWCGGTRTAAGGRAMTSPTHPRQGARLPAAARCPRRCRPVRYRSVHHAGRRQGLAVRRPG